MNRRIIVLGTGALAVIGFAAAATIFNRTASERAKQAPAPESTELVRPHSPVIGPANAPVTIVEFFDPACETCRAMYPVVKKIMAEFPKEVRLVIRYAAFHKGSDEAVRILEAARQQGNYVPVMEAILARQPEWADHGRPDIDRAWAAAATAGLNVETARKGMFAPAITSVLTQDAADIRKVGVRQTPTFFVNGKSLPSFGPRQLYELVRSEVDGVRKH